MDSRAIFAAFIFSAIVLIGWKWLRSRKKEEESTEDSIPQFRSRRSLTPDGVTSPDSEEVKTKPHFSSATTQHLQHDGLDVYIVSSLSECDVILSGIPRENLSLCGFDCEWSQSYHLDEIVQEEGATNSFIYPVALVQIATMDSRCYLIQLSNMDNRIPQSLVEILEDKRCLKFGVNALNDLNRLKTHYFIRPAGAVDLRHLARGNIEGERMGLQALTKHFLGINLNKDPLLQRSNWQSRNLSFEQIIYAAMDAKISLNILLAIIQHVSRESSLPQPVHCSGLGIPSFELVEFISEICAPFVDVSFTGGSSSRRRSQQRRTNNPGLVSDERLANKPAPFVTRKRALYENCQLLAPDNELLSLIDRRKAGWYFERNLAELVSEEPYIVRLKFEPKSRPEKENVDKTYYQAEKLNICVVCGEKDGNGIRKKIVPSEYRKYFPVDHKSYKSHDNLLLCGRCHLRTNLYEDSLKDQIAKEYDSPIDSGASKLLSDPTLYRAKNAARALVQSKNKLPEEKSAQFVEILQNFYQVEELDDNLIRNAANIDPKKENPSYTPHGQKVVEKVLANGELLQFQMRWREHFLATMKPKFLPEMWSITHNPNKVQYF